jgi:hypothetical protein
VVGRQRSWAEASLDALGGVVRAVSPHAILCSQSASQALCDDGFESGRILQSRSQQGEYEIQFIKATNLKSNKPMETLRLPFHRLNEGNASILSILGNSRRGCQLGNVFPPANKDDGAPVLLSWCQF